MLQLRLYLPPFGILFTSFFVVSWDVAKNINIYINIKIGFRNVVQAFMSFNQNLISCYIL